MLAVLGLALNGLAVGITAEALGPAPFEFLAGRPIVWMPITMIAAFLGALSICLPSFYFYTQLSGIDASFRVVTAQALRAQATTSVLLLAALPVYLVVALAHIAVGFMDVPTVIMCGLGLPFVVGLIGVGAVYKSFSRLAKKMPITHQRRGSFVKRLVVAWGAVYTFVAPVALVRIGQALSGVF